MAPNHNLTISHHHLLKTHKFSPSNVFLQLQMLLSRLKIPPVYFKLTCVVSPQSVSSPSRSAGEASQTDESKASQQQQAVNVEDERKQQAARAPCIADTGQYIADI